MKKKEWAHANRMLFESGNEEFDRQTTLISTGNVIADTQLSFHIRARKKMECYGHLFPAGHLRDIDLKNFPRLPSRVLRVVIDLTETESVILYQFHHRHEHDGQVTHGYIITTPRHRLLLKIVTGPTYKSGLVIAEAAKYVAD